MFRRLSAPDVAASIISRSTLLEGGATERGINRLVHQRELIVVRRGWYIDATLHAELRPEDRHLAHVFAVARDGSQHAVASHTSAAVLWGLPLYRTPAPRVQLSVPRGQRISSGSDVIRHAHDLAEADVVVLHGVRVTALRRTVFDLIRTMSPEAAVAVADAAEREVTFADWVWDVDERAKWRGDLRELIEAAPGARGIRRARRIAEFANGRAQLPLESVSRLQLSRLGYAPPRLQVPVPDPKGGSYWMDLAMDELRSTVP